MQPISLFLMILKNTQLTFPEWLPIRNISMTYVALLWKPGRVTCPNVCLLRLAGTLAVSIDFIVCFAILSDSSTYNLLPNFFKNVYVHLHQSLVRFILMFKLIRDYGMVWCDRLMSETRLPCDYDILSYFARQRLRYVVFCIARIGLISI